MKLLKFIKIIKKLYKDYIPPEYQLIKIKNNIAEYKGNDLIIKTKFIHNQIITDGYYNIFLLEKERDLLDSDYDENKILEYDSILEYNYINPDITYATLIKNDILVKMKNFLLIDKIFKEKKQKYIKIFYNKNNKNKILILSTHNIEYENNTYIINENLIKNSILLYNLYSE